MRRWADCMSDLGPEPAKRPNPDVGLGFQLAVGMAVFTGIGYWIDRKRGGDVIFTLAGAALGLFYVGYELWKLSRRMSESEAREQKDEK